MQIGAFGRLVGDDDQSNPTCQSGDKVFYARAGAGLDSGILKYATRDERIATGGRKDYDPLG